VNLDRLHEPEVFAIVEESARTGVFRGPGEAGLFTTGYFHLPREFSREIAEAGFKAVEVLQVEGPGFFVRDLDARWSDPGRREALFKAARLVEREPEVLAASSHLLGWLAARRSSPTASRIGLSQIPLLVTPRASRAPLKDALGATRSFVGLLPTWPKAIEVLVRDL
jgi:hypothetical protein